MTDVETIDCESALDFIEALRPDQQRWTHPYQRWIFRGQADPWPLRPTSLRGSVKAYRTVLDRSESAFGDVPQWLEFGLLRNFLEAADDQGIQVPGDDSDARATALSHSVWIKAHNPGRGDPFAWPADVLLPMLALAQHHGVPTRLLDWSRSSFIAAYFAVAEAARRLPSPDEEDPDGRKLIVWALNAYAAASPTSPPLAVGDREAKLRLVEVPTGLNSNLAAQRGVFTLLREMTPDGPALESLAPPEHLRRITLPWCEAPKALYRLHLYRVDGGSVYPGPGGAARRVLEMTLMRRG